MKKLLLSKFIVILFLNSTFAQWDTLIKPHENYFVSYITNHNNNLYCGGGNGIYKYNGSSWLDLTNGNFQNSSNTNVEIIFAGNTMYVRSTVKGIYKSNENGTTWEMDTAGLPQMSAYNNEPWSLFYDGTYIYASLGYYNYGFYRKQPSDNSWTKLSEIGNSSSIVWGLTKLGSNLYAIATDGCWESTNGGQTWNKKTSINLPQIYSNWHVTNAGNTFITHNSALYFGSDNGLFKSSDNGDNWTRIDNNFQTFYGSVGISALHSNGTDIFASTRNTNNAYKSSDNGNSWTDISSGLVGKISSFTWLNSKLYATIGTEKNVYFYNDGSSSVEKIDELKFNIYPNPTENSVFVGGLNSAEKYNIEILSIDGKQISNQELNGNSINIQDLSSGIYFVKVTDNEGKIGMQKITKR